MEPDEVQAYVWYMWTCPACVEVQEADPPDVDPTGTEAECRDCGTEVVMTGSAS